MTLLDRPIRAVLGSALVLAACSTDVLVGEGTSTERVRTDGGSGGGGQTAVDGGAITCGKTLCFPREVGGPLGLAAPCCYSGSKCGAVLSSACVETDAEGTPDPSCPSFASYPGCCKPDGTCGLNATGTPFGCVDPFTLAPMLSLGQCTPRDQ